MFADAFQSPSTVAVEYGRPARRARGIGDAVSADVQTAQIFVLTLPSPATVADDYDVSVLNGLVADVFKSFDAVFVADEGETLHVFAIAADHDDDAYERMARAEDQLAARRPGLMFEVHLRATRGRLPTVVAPAGSRQVHARR